MESPSEAAERHLPIDTATLFGTPKNGQASSKLLVEKTRRPAHGGISIAMDLTCFRSFSQGEDGDEGLRRDRLPLRPYCGQRYQNHKSTSNGL